MIKSSVPYQYAITQASNNAEIISVLGEPIETHSMMQGEISTTNDTGKVDVKVPLKGPKGEGVLVIVGEKVNGVWVYETLYFSTETKTIDLLEDTLIDF